MEVLGCGGVGGGLVVELCVDQLCEIVGYFVDQCLIVDLVCELVQ